MFGSFGGLLAEILMCEDRQANRFFLLRVTYQPVVAVKGHRIVGLEALAR